MMGRSPNATENRELRLAYEGWLPLISKHDTGSTTLAGSALLP